MNNNINKQPKLKAIPKRYMQICHFDREQTKRPSSKAFARNGDPPIQFGEIPQKSLKYLFGITYLDC